DGPHGQRRPHHPGWRSLSGVRGPITMYQPRLFKESDLARIHKLVRAYPFATVVHSGAHGFDANHLPLLLDEKRGPEGTLRGHVARANPLWRELDGSREVLAIFHGPHAYVSSNFYAKPEEHVPTWNYAVVHAHGRPRVLEQPEELLGLLRDL